MRRSRRDATAVRASQRSLKVREFFVARPLTTVTLPLRCAGHSHRDVMPGRGSSAGR